MHLNCLLVEVGQVSQDHFLKDKWLRIISKFKRNKKPEIKENKLVNTSDISINDYESYGGQDKAEQNSQKNIKNKPLEKTKTKDEIENIVVEDIDEKCMEEECEVNIDNNHSHHHHHH